MRRRLTPLLLALVACSAYRLPDISGAPPSDPAPTLGAAIIVPAPLPVYVSPQEAGEFRTRLRDDLAATGLFASVEFGETADASAVAVRPDYQQRLCFAEPLITAITLGLVPYPGCYYSGYRLTLSSPRFAHDIVVDNRSNPSWLWGWLAGPISLLPGWSSSLPTEAERESLRLALQRATLLAVAEPPDASGRLAP